MKGGLTFPKMARFIDENFIAIASLSFTSLECLGAIILAFVLFHKLPPVEKWIIAWLFYDAMTHFTLVRLSPRGILTPGGVPLGL